MIYLANITESSNIDLWCNLFNSSSYRKKASMRNFEFLKNKKSLLGDYLLKLALKENNILNYEIKHNFYGKPFLVGSENIKFNISHSGDWVVCICNEMEVGIDIEKICDINYDNIAKRFFNKEEYTFLSNYNFIDEKLKIFYKLWTLKECYIKMLGIGLSIPLNSFSVIENNVIREQIKNTGSICYLKNIEILRGYELSVCCKNGKVDDTHKFVQLSQLMNL